MTRFEAWGYTLSLLAAVLFFGLSTHQAFSAELPIPGYAVVCEPGVVSFEHFSELDPAKEHARALATRFGTNCYVMSMTVQATPHATLGPVE